jgi:hypothetical protein
MDRVLEVVTWKNAPLPKSIQQTFPDWDVARSHLYAIYTLRPDKVRDEHLELLESALKARGIVHWGCSDGQDASTYRKKETYFGESY